jgi:transcriptional regulator with XRE-family HTH domain
MNESKDAWIKKMVSKIMEESDYLRDKKTAGEIVKHLRKSLHLTQYQSGIPNNRLSMIEHGNLPYSIKIVEKILFNFFDTAEKIHDEIENILWPMDEDESCDRASL